MLQSVRFHARALVHGWRTVAGSVLFCVLLVAGPGSAAGVQQRLLEACNGDPIPALAYRPRGPASGAVILAADAREAGAACWGGLPDSLCQRGFQVLVVGGDPQPAALREVGRTPWLAHWDHCAARAACSDTVTWVALVCLGGTGWETARLVAADPRLQAVVWVSPSPAGDGWSAWEPGGGDRLPVLFIASQEEIESSTLAGDLFSQFNGCAELRLLSRGVGGCRLLEPRRIRDGLLGWLESRFRDTATPRGE